MPSAPGKTYTFYDADREAYPFFAPDGKLVTATRIALRWSRKTGTKLYRAKHGASPNKEGK